VIEHHLDLHSLNLDSSLEARSLPQLLRAREDGQVDGLLVRGATRS